LAAEDQKKFKGALGGGFFDFAHNACSPLLKKGAV
jgi:hypothetical protein